MRTLAPSDDDVDWVGKGRGWEEGEEEEKKGSPLGPAECEPGPL